MTIFEALRAHGALSAAELLNLTAGHDMEKRENVIATATELCRSGELEAISWRGNGWRVPGFRLKTP